MVIFNVAKNGTSDERKANAGYGGEVLALFAEVGAGPMYIGESVTLEGEAGVPMSALWFKHVDDPSGIHDNRLKIPPPEKEVFGIGVAARRSAAGLNGLSFLHTGPIRPCWAQRLFLSQSARSVFQSPILKEPS